MFPLLDTVDRLPIGALVDLGDRSAVLAAVTSDPCPESPWRRRLDFAHGEEPEWRLPGEILPYALLPTAAQLAAWAAEHAADA